MTDVDKHDFAIETPVCGVCAARDRADRMLADKDDKSRKVFGDDPPANRVDPADGRRVVIRYKGKAKPPPTT